VEVASMDISRQTLTVEEVAKILGIGRTSTFEAIHRGEISHLRIGGRIVIPIAALEKMLTPDDHAVPIKED